MHTRTMVEIRHIHKIQFRTSLRHSRATSAPTAEGYAARWMVFQAVEVDELLLFSPFLRRQTNNFVGWGFPAAVIVPKFRLHSKWDLKCAFCTASSKLEGIAALLYD